MTHLEWGLLALVATAVLGALAAGPVWWAAGYRRGRQVEAEEADLDRAAARHPAGRHRHPDGPPRHAAGYLPAPVQERAGAYGPFPVPDEELTELLTAPRPTLAWPEPGTPNQAMVLPAEELSWTGEIAAMTAAFQEDMASLISGTDEKLKEITR